MNSKNFDGTHPIITLNSSAEDIYKFLCKNVYWSEVIKLYRILKRDIEGSNNE